MNYSKPYENILRKRIGYSWQQHEWKVLPFYPTHLCGHGNKACQGFTYKLCKSIDLEPDPFSSSYSKFANEDSFVLCLASLFVPLMGSALYSRRALGDDSSAKQLVTTQPWWEGPLLANSARQVVTRQSLCKGTLVANCAMQVVTQQAWQNQAPTACFLT